MISSCKKVVKGGAPFALLFIDKKTRWKWHGIDCILSVDLRMHFPQCKKRSKECGWTNKRGPGAENYKLPSKTSSNVIPFIEEALDEGKVLLPKRHLCCRDSTSAKN